MDTISIFNDVSSETKDVLIKSSRKIIVGSHKQIINYGTPANGLFIIRSGIIKVSAYNNRGFKSLLFLLGENKVFGANSIIPEAVFRIDVSALNEVELYFIPKDVLMERMKHDSKFLFNLFNWMCEEIEHIENTIIYNLKSNVTARFASLLLNNEFKNKNIFLLQDISIQEIADLLGTTKTYLMNTINKLKKSSIIDYDRKSIIILNSIVLRKLIDSEEPFNG